MIAADLISDILPSVKSGDEAARALDWMAEFKLSQLPIVDEGKYKGIISEDDILDAADLKIPVGNIRYTGWDGAFVRGNNHIYDVVKVLTNLRLEVLPVLDEEDNYLGVITLRDLLLHFQQLFAISEPGSVIELEMSEKDYSLSEIGRIVESADAKVLSLYLNRDPMTGKVLITLKVNVENPAHVLAGLERFDYEILKTYRPAGHRLDYQRNIDALMRYLDI